jgi:hypothetical protein
MIICGPGLSANHDPGPVMAGVDGERPGLIDPLAPVGTT